MSWSWKCFDKKLPVPPSLTLSQLSMGVTPGLPSSPFSPLAPDMPGTPGNPWEQFSPQPSWVIEHTHTQKHAYLKTQFSWQKLEKQKERKVTECNKTPLPKMNFCSWTYLTISSSRVLRQLVGSSGILQKGQGNGNKINIHLRTLRHQRQSLRETLSLSKSALFPMLFSK